MISSPLSLSRVVGSKGYEFASLEARAGQRRISNPGEKSGRFKFTPTKH